MAHQPPITTVVVRQLVLAIAVRIRFGEKLLQVGQATVHRIARHVQDAGLRQRLGDETDMQEIQRQLVGEPRLAAGAPLRMLQVALAQHSEIDPPSRFEQLRIDEVLRETVAAPAQLQRQVVQLAGVFDLGMSAQDAFEQGGAGARQADDEDRLRALVAARQGLARRRRAPTPQGLERSGFVARTIVEHGAFGRTAQTQRLPGILMTFEIVQFLEQRERQHGAIARRQIARQQDLQTRHVVGSFSLSAQSREQPMRLRMRGCARKTGFGGRARFDKAAAEQFDVAAQVARLRAGP